ncbi:unnamed protein product [Zymoseptoria tritici ST99CH_1E4]|uniref:Centrosomin N-terminal motif 1 domain-containing protein n=1 Tax=Zymoseptoria tritici ST99CH_1E4 TaxID=1276532 RepID=A0A2H1H4D1_ZYMTR|nr:unnamed protein product [Zymoseptoria tritici ST99CH_1E4]
MADSDGGSVDHSDNKAHIGNPRSGPFARRDSELTDLPTGEHSYLHEHDGPSFLKSGEEQGNDHSFDERAMNRHFQDVESSFLPETTAAPAVEEQEPIGADDTYLELAQPPSVQSGVEDEEEREQSSQADTLAGGYQTAAAERFDDGQDEDVTGEHPSSPAAAAAERTHARTASSAKLTRTQPTSMTMESNSRSSPSPSIRGVRPPSAGSTLRDTSSPQPAKLSVGPSESSFLSSPNGDKPTQLNPRASMRNARQASTISMLSSVTNTSDLSGSEAVYNTDFALQTGGATGDRTTKAASRPKRAAHRVPSIASVGSFMSAGESSFPRDVSNASLLASRAESRFDGTRSMAGLETPRATTSNFHAPTDTVIAKHVQSIQVPETVARNFRLRNRSASPEKRPASSGGFGTSSVQGPRRALTLKEQNSKIDKLTKENFDLKLKIHFLDQALQNRSDDGVRELIEKNVQFQTDLANERKEAQSLRKKMKEMEKRMKEQEDALKEARQQKHTERDDDDDPVLQAEMHEEILYLRQQLDHSENTVTTLRDEVMTKEFEKRKMAEHMRGMAGKRGEDSSGMKENMDMWQDLLNAETGRREQAEEDLTKLRKELNALRVERQSPVASRTRNGHYADEGNDAHNVELAESNAAIEQLKHENSELRRDLGAQTSMLTSRNRERERLQQEIEDLKLLQRKGDARSVAGESIFDRSISRAHHQRSQSRAGSELPILNEVEREEWDRKEGQLRDQNAELRIKYQELERSHNTHLQYVTVLEGDFQEMEQELGECQDDLLKLQTERDDTLQAYEEKEQEYAQLKEEALTEISALDEEKKALEQDLTNAENRLQKTLNKLQTTTDGYRGLQGELREITQSVMNLEDEKQANMKTIQNLESQISEMEEEISKWEQKCNEVEEKNRKLEITTESLHSEITFLREEQEGDKIKIGELEDALNAAQHQISDEQEKLREVEEGIFEERQQRDVLENKSKEDVQKVLDDLNSENAKSKDEVRRLRRSLATKEVESGSWKQKLDELEQNLRSILGDPDGTKQSLLAEIEKLQRDLETTAGQLDRAKMDLSDKDRLLRHRDGLLESTSLESRRLSDLLEKERSSRKHDLEQFEKASRGQATHMRTIAQQESRVLELETAYSQDKRKMALLESQFRDQLSDRNTLLFALWNRLSTLCGADWTQTNGMVHGENTTIEVIARKQLHPFHDNILNAVKTIEALLGGFKGRIRSIEKELWRDYQTLEHNLSLRIKRQDALEIAVQQAQQAFAEEAAKRFAIERAALESRSGSGSTSKKSIEEVTRLKHEVKILTTELKIHRKNPSQQALQMMQQAYQQTSSSASSVHHLNGEWTDGGKNNNLPFMRRESSSGDSSQKSKDSPARNFVANLLRTNSTTQKTTTTDYEQHYTATHRSRPSTASTIQAPPRPSTSHHTGTTGTGGGEVLWNHAQAPQPIVLAEGRPGSQASDQRWVHRLKELERRLKAEREARLLDRKGARKRLEEGRVENEELRRRLEREMAGSSRGGSVVDGQEERWEGDGDEEGEDGARWEQGVEERDEDGDYEVYVGRDDGLEGGGGRSMSRGRDRSVD